MRLLREHRGQYPSLTAACAAVARQERIGAETLRRWALQAEIDEGTRPGTTSQEHEQIKRLKAENARLREDVAILKTATTCFAGELDPATADRRVHRHRSQRGSRRPRRSAESCPNRAARSPRAPNGHDEPVSFRPGPSATPRFSRRSTSSPGPATPQGRRKLTPEGLYGRRKMLALLRLQGVAATPGRSTGGRGIWACRGWFARRASAPPTWAKTAIGPVIC